MNTNPQITINTTENFSQNDEVRQSDKVALLMGAFSIVTLVIAMAILSVLHYFFS